MRTTKAILVLIGALSLLIAVNASAGFSLTLDTGNSAISGFTGPYATVNVNLTNPTQATITFTSLTNSGNIYLMGGHGAADVNVSAASWTIGSITASNSGTGFSTASSDFTSGGSGNVSAFGVFNQTIDGFAGFTHSADSISFILTNTSGAWGDAASVLIANSDGNPVAAHIFVTGSPANKSNGALTTGFAADPAPSVARVPEPGILILLGMGMTAIGVASRWIRKI